MRNKHEHNWRLVLGALLLFVVFAATTFAQETQAPQTRDDFEATHSSENVTNASNNPVTPQTQIILQNYFMPSVDGYRGRAADEELVRLYLPIKLFGVQNIFRVYQPIDANPLFPNGTDAGLGDTTVYDLALHNAGKFTVGAGPLLVLPVASHKDSGLGKWQAGIAGIVVTERSWGLIGTVITYQHSFSGYGSGRPAAQLVTVQPLIHYNFNGGYYLRSSGSWSLDYSNGVKYIPIGLGAGKVLKLPNGVVMNLYVEPQYSVYHAGYGAPKWQVLSAVTFQFPTRTKEDRH